MTIETDALEYHEFPRPGKIAIMPTKPCETARDLSLAYSPGVATPCLEIAAKGEDAYRYTSKGNLVAVVSNGSAVLGLGDIGPLGAKPVMEGKGVLFKTFADIDVFDIELNARTVEEVVNAVVAIAPTFGGINLEDIKAPECFEIERQLIERLDIPVFHDDQHGTAIIAAAALVNALEVARKEIGEVKLVMSGAGAAAIASAHLLFLLGLKRENLLLVDSAGVIYRGRTQGMNRYKNEFCVETPCRTLEDAMRGADVFFGLSAKDLVTPEMLRSMARDPIVFAMANPDPEIDYAVAKATRPDVIMATGRSDFPNQVNNVLGFPFIFRGALDVRARVINDAMKLAAVRSLAELAKEPVPDVVLAAYEGREFTFGPEYLIPKPFDTRVLYHVAPAVAHAAIRSGVARNAIDIEEYTLRLKAKQNHGRVILRSYYDVARSAERKRIAFPEGSNDKVLQAAVMAAREGIVQPVFLGKIARIEEEARRLDLDLSGFEIVEPPLDARYERYTDAYYELRKRRGVSRIEAERAIRLENMFANMMLTQGDVDGVICGVDRSFPEMMRPILETVGVRDGVATAAALFIVTVGDRTLFFADTAINVEMSSEKLAEISIMSADFAESMHVHPRIALLSYSNFGSNRDPGISMIQRARDLVLQSRPDLAIDGEMQADAAVEAGILRGHYPFSTLDGPANVLVFPDMQSANISFKLLQRLGGARVIGPIILGLRKPAYVLQRHASIDEIFNMITVAVGQSEINVRGRQTRALNTNPPLRIANG